MKIPKILLLFFVLIVTMVKGEDKAEEEFTCGRLFYRTLHLDEANDVLYVGAMDRLMRINAGNVSATDCERDTMHFPPEVSTSPSHCFLLLTGWMVQGGSKTKIVKGAVAKFG